MDWSVAYVNRSAVSTVAKVTEVRKPTKPDPIDDFELVPKDTTSPRYPDYLKQGTKTSIGDTALPCELGNFIKAKYREKFPVKADLRSTIIDFNHFSLHPWIDNQTAAVKYIQSYKDNQQLVICPYGAKHRLIGEDHTVLLAMKGGKSEIIDPKLGIFLDLETNKTQALRWQKDSVSCTFYVYYMITTLIITSQDNQFSQIQSVSDVYQFFKAMPAPKVEDIKKSMREVLDIVWDQPNGSQDTELERDDIIS